MILYRPVSLQELELIYEGGMKAFPARLPKQPVFYPVLQLEYARQTASSWTTKSGGSAGYVTQFNVEDKHLKKFEKHTVRGTQYQELWIPAEDVEEFNKHITGHIKVVEAYFKEGFEGFIPQGFSLQGKNAVDQFTELANSYLYKKMDFYLEIRRNHKAIFLNYPFWQNYEFKNPGLKEKIIKAIKEGWSTSFPQIPLPSPLTKPADSLDDSDEEDITPDDQDNSYEERSANPAPKKVSSIKQTYANSLVKPIRENPRPVESSDTKTQAKPGAERLDDPDQKDITPEEQADSEEESPLQGEIMTEEEADAHMYKRRLADSVHEKFPPLKQTYAGSLNDPPEEDIPPPEQSSSRVPERPAPQAAMPPAQIDSHFVQGIKLGLAGEYQEAIAELSRAVEENPEDVSARTSMGVAFHHLDQDERALASYEATLKIDPIYAEAHYFRANILYNRGHVREAIAGYTIAIGLKPELIEAHQNPIPEDRLTDYSLSPAEMIWIAKPARRILNLNKSLQTNPRHANQFKERAAEYYRLRNYSQAITDYTSALELQPDDAGALHSRGIAYEGLGQNDRALQDYQRALSINPQLSDEYIQRGIELGKTGNFRQSIASLTEGIRLSPKNPNAYFNRGMTYFHHGDFENAIPDFSKVIELSSQDEDAYYFRGLSSEVTGRQREAIADYRQFLALSQNEDARLEIEGRLRAWREWNEGERNGTSQRSPTQEEGQANQVQSEIPRHGPDLYDLIAALGQRAIDSTWFGSGVNCRGETAEELYASTDQNRPIEGHDFLRIAAGIQQTIAGDFQAFEPDIATPWIFIRAWDGNGFYIETDDTQIEQQLKTSFPAMEEVEGASPPYAGLFIPV